MVLGQRRGQGSHQGPPEHKLGAAADGAAGPRAPLVRQAQRLPRRHRGPRQQRRERHRGRGTGGTGGRGPEKLPGGGATDSAHPGTLGTTGGGDCIESESVQGVQPEKLARGSVSVHAFVEQKGLTGTECLMGCLLVKILTKI